MIFFSECQITDKGIQINVLFFSRTIPFGEIKSLRKVPFWRAILESMNPRQPTLWSTGDLSLGGVVIIETTKNSRISVSPRNSDEFVRIVSSHLLT
jgi:hypothetical protein